MALQKPKSEMTPEELAAKEQEEFNVGPLSILTQSVKNNTQVHLRVVFPPGCVFAGSDQLSQQQEAARSCEGVRQTLQYGVGECEGDVDGIAEDRQRQEEGAM